MHLPTSPSDSFKRANPHIYAVKTPTEPVRKRIRQSAKPLMNKLEAEFYAVLQREFPSEPIKAQSVKLRLANGVWLTPDFVVFHANRSPSAWETKGPHAWEDSIVKLKVAATLYPELSFFIVWKEAGRWKRQKVLV